MKNLIAWVEIPTIDFNRAVEFYNSVLAVKLQALDFGSEKMACLPDDAGAIVFAKGYEPSSQGVVVSLNVGGELEATIKRVENAGGKIITPKTKIEAPNREYFAIFIDTEGNRLGLYGN